MGMVGLLFIFRQFPPVFSSSVPFLVAQKCPVQVNFHGIFETPIDNKILKLEFQNISPWGIQFRVGFSGHWIIYKYLYSSYHSNPHEVMYTLYYTVLCHSVLYCTVLCHSVLYCTVLHYTIVYCIVLYCAIVYCTVLYCAIVYCMLILGSLWILVNLSGSLDYCRYLNTYCTILYCTIL